MLLGDLDTVEEVLQSDMSDAQCEKHCLGSFYIKPNYPGRSSHVCNGGFLVSNPARNRGVGKLMGEGKTSCTSDIVTDAVRLFGMGAEAGELLNCWYWI